MRSPLKRILPILLVIMVLFSLIWYLFVYDREFTRDMLLKQARYFESRGQYAISSWLYNQAYYQSGENEDVAIELAEQFKAAGNYTKAEYTLSNAIADGGSAELYIALCKTYLEQDKLLDAVTMLDNIADPAIKAELDARRPGVPVATPAPGYYSQYISVSIEAQSGTLYVSSDGTYPSKKEDLYSTGVSLNAGENMIYALSISDEGLVSPLAVFGYTVGGVIEEVTFADSAMDTYVRELLKVDSDTWILTSDLWTVNTLVLPSAVIDYSDLKYFPYLTSLTIQDSSVANLQILSTLTKLSDLTITGTNVSADALSVIAGLPDLTRLTLSGCNLSGIQNLSGATKLTYLDLSENAINNIAPLSSMTGLLALNLSKNALTSLTDLGAMAQLNALDVSYNSLSSIAPLAGFTGLTELNVSNNSLMDLTGIESLKSLHKLNASHNALTQTDILAGCTGLTDLILSHNTLLDINAVSALDSLQYLDFSYNEVESLPPWNHKPGIVHINGSHNKLINIDALSGCVQLNTVIMNDNQIESIESLARCVNLVRVDVSNTLVSNVSMLTDQGIIVHYTPKN